MEKFERYASDFPSYNDNIQFDGNFSEKTKQEIYQFLYSGHGRFESPCPQIDLYPLENLFSPYMHYLFNRITQSVLFYNRQTGRLHVSVEQYIPLGNSGKYLSDRHGLPIFPGMKEDICNISRILITMETEEEYSILVETNTEIGEIFPDDYLPQRTGESFYMNDLYGKLALYTNSEAVDDCTSVRHHY